MAEPATSSGSIHKEDEDDEDLASFLESEILSGSKDQGEASVGRATKKRRIEHDEETHSRRNRYPPPPPRSLRQIETGFFSRMPPELFHHIFKFLSPEDLVSCALVCKFMSFAASDERLWYGLRWGLDSSRGQMRDVAWKLLYIKRDEEDMIEFVRSTPSEFKEYYILMQAAKRSQAPLPSQVNDDILILDRTVAEQVSVWKSKRGLSDEAATGHLCSGNTCSYTQIGDAFICERTGCVHVCDDTCPKVVWDQTTKILVCTISGRCFDAAFLPAEKKCPIDTDQQQSGEEDEEEEPSTESERFDRAYLLGYNCMNEKELQAALRLN